MMADIFDIFIALTLAAFTISGISAGMIGELAGIISVLGGFWAAREWHDDMAPYLNFIADPGWRSVAAYAIVFLAAMIGIAILARILKKIISFSFMSWADKLMGGLLGLAKGLLLWTVVIVLLVKIFPDAEFLRDSRALPYFRMIIQMIQPWLPTDLASQIAI